MCVSFGDDSTNRCGLRFAFNMLLVVSSPILNIQSCRRADRPGSSDPQNPYGASLKYVFCISPADSYTLKTRSQQLQPV